MNIIQLPEKQAHGFCARTSNEAEQTPETAQIGTLWQQFYQRTGTHLTAQSNVYGVYTNYESDVTGLFDVYACTDNPMVAGLDEVKTVTLQSGNYLKFSGAGEMPQAVIDTWGEVWAYFTSTDCSHTRAYTTDFEVYTSPNEVEIYIAIQ